jgi:hypothetical protein
LIVTKHRVRKLIQKIGLRGKLFEFELGLTFIGLPIHGRVVAFSR